MALNWYTDKIAKRQGEERYHILTTHPLGRSGPREGWKWHPVTEALVGLSMNCGFYEVRETNALEIARRIATYERTRGAVLVTCRNSTEDARPAYLTFEDVWNHVGLLTNASPFSRKKFEDHYGPLAEPVFGESAHDQIENVYASMASEAA